MGKFDSFFDDAVVNAKAAASAVSKKAVTFYDASKHKISAAEIRGEINKKLKELGKVTYKSEVHGTDLFVEKEALIAEIKELIENLNVINGHIAAIRSQRKCPRCEARVPKNSVFCNICGAKLDEADAEPSVMASAETPAETPAEEPAKEPETAQPAAEAAEAAAEKAEEAAQTVAEAVEEKAEQVAEAVKEKAEKAANVIEGAIPAADDSSDDLFV